MLKKPVLIFYFLTKKNMPNLQEKPIIKSLVGVDIEAYLENLKQWILDNQETYFTDPDYGAMSYCDFNDFNKTNVARRNLCMPDELMLIDRQDKRGVHMYSITSITKQRKAKDHYFVIEVDLLSRKNWRNGYFLLPDLSHTF